LKRSKAKQLYRGRRQPSIYSRTEENIAKKDYKKGFLVSLLIILVAGLIYFLFFSPFFKVDRVEVNNLRYGEREQIDKVISEFREGFFSRNMLTFRTKSLKTKLESQYGIKTAEVRKVYPHQIEVRLEERLPAMVWQVIDRKYLVDESGAIWGDYDEKFADIPVIQDLKNLPVETGKKVVPEEFTEFITSLAKEFDDYTEAKMVKLEVGDTTEDLKVTSSSTWYAYFDTTRTAKNQLINLSRILNEVEMKNKKLEYIDLRVNNRIFYK
jgi:cell division protein FtsQ